MESQYDIIVVGAGHAGCEAACAASNLGAKTLMVTLNRESVARMSCNPAVGGIAKGQIVREIDAMGGYTGIVADRSMLQFKMLNRSKGPAMWSPRSQNDTRLFTLEWISVLDSMKNLDFIQDDAKSLIIENNTVRGIRTAMGKSVYAKAVILANGTFLNGRIHIGEVSFTGGRLGEQNSVGISDQLLSLGFTVEKLKTGTPVRIDGRTIDYSALIEQPFDDVPGKFSFSDETQCLDISKQRRCYIAHTSPEVHDILKEGFDRSPMFQGRIKGKGPRYCPSIEDKLNRFADKTQHPIFVEPEGFNNIEVYLNGFSSSLPEEIQYRAIRKMAGFEHAKFMKPGYAIEYDFFQPTQLKSTLETKQISNLYFTGQINGTTGYEEAACQGLMAGINAVRKIRNEDPIVLSRSEAYIGVLIDDLITKGVDEPYRMFTSRAEHRILLRQDNADIRLTPLSHNIGLADDKRYNRVEDKIDKTERLGAFLEATNITRDEANPYLSTLLSGPVNESTRLSKIILRPDVSIGTLKNFSVALRNFINENKIDDETMEETEIQIKYKGYINKEEIMADRLNSMDRIHLKNTIDYMAITSISYESREKLSRIKPSTIGQASRIPGVSPSDIAALMIVLGI